MYTKKLPSKSSAKKNYSSASAVNKKIYKKASISYNQVLQGDMEIIITPWYDLQTSSWFDQQLSPTVSVSCPKNPKEHNCHQKKEQHHWQNGNAHKDASVGRHNWFHPLSVSTQSRFYLKQVTITKRSYNKTIYLLLVECSKQRQWNGRSGS